MQRRRALEALAVLLSFSIVVVLFAGLDNLPRQLRKDIAAEQTALQQSEKQFQSGKAGVVKDLAAEPALFRAHDMATRFPQRLSVAESKLLTADKEMAELARVNQRNRRSERDVAEKLLRDERHYRNDAMAEVSAMHAEADRWVERKRNLPAELAHMAQDYQAARGANLAAAAAAVQKAETDWPEKKADLESRLAAIRALGTQADQTWQQSEPLRRAAAGGAQDLDYATLFSQADDLHGDAIAVPAKATELQALTGQLYVAWDKVLVDLDKERGEYREKLRTVRTKIEDPAGKKSDITTDEAWVPVPKSTYDAMERNLGMTVEHKSAGKYDSEAEHTVQPAGFAYMASPAQGGNQYGYWDHRGGQSFWVWYGQYALLRDLLFNRNYRPLDTRDWDGYRTAQRSGQTYYGRDFETGQPKYGTQGTVTQRSYRDSTYARQSGSYGGSKYSSPASRSREEPFGFSTGRSSGGSGKTFGSPSRSRPSFGGGGRSFGGGGRSFGRRR